MLPFLLFFGFDAVAIAVAVLCGIGGYWLGWKASQTNPNSPLPTVFAVGSAGAGYLVAYVLLVVAFLFAMGLLLWHYRALVERGVVSGVLAIRRSLGKRTAHSFVDRFVELLEQHEDNIEHIQSLALFPELEKRVIEIEERAFENRLDQLGEKVAPPFQ